MENVNNNINTGNSILDEIIADKNNYCHRNNIILMSMADGKQLSFLKGEDTAFIIGSLLNNAIAYTEKSEDTEKRIVKLAIFKKKEFLIIRCENYLAEDIAFHKELPVVNNEKYSYKKIKSSLRKYDGGLTALKLDDWLTVCILIPINTAIS